MARLIDANSILDDFLKRYTEREKDRKLVFAACEIKQDFADMISNATTVDAVEVVHGRWEEMHYEGGILDGTNFDRCSVCGYERVFNDPALKTVFKYCPNCGAKMDEEVSE